MKLRTALMAATVLVAPVAAMAQPVAGPYVSLGAGYNLMQNETLKGNSSGVATNLKVQGGFAGNVAVGYGLGNGLRLEVEGAYTSNKLNQLGGGNGTPNGFGAHGQEQKPEAFLNAIYDIDAGLGWMSPYVGVGAGYAWSIWKPVNIYGSTATTYNNNYINSNQGSFAAQGILGASFPVPSVPGLAVTADYRFTALTGDRSYSTISTTTTTVLGRTTTATTAGTAKFGDDFNHTFTLGLRYAFNAAPPPPPPAPAPMAAPTPAPARTYLVFFDWDRADLTDRARQIIKEAATASTRVTYTQIKVNGYTDLSGTAAYNQRLSVRRAQSVAAELVRDGVARTAIAIQGFGESNPLVPTAKGVREPQNRRVEIVIQ